MSQCVRVGGGRKWVDESVCEGGRGKEVGG